MRFLLFALLLAAPAPASAQQAAREVILTSDSELGWLPSIALEQAVLRATQDYFDALEAGDPARAYAMLSPERQRQTMLSTFFEQSRRQRDSAGSLRERRLLRLTWSKDPPGAPVPGIYAAIDIASRHAQVSRECGYLVWHRRSEGGPFKLMRAESNQIDNATADSIAGQKGQPELDRLWAGLSARCPNYTPDP
jgi:uncharacterized protein DUF4019